MPRVQLWLLFLTGLWLITLVLGIWLFFTGEMSPDISSEQRDWTTYPPFDPNWSYQVGTMMTVLALGTCVLDVAIRIVLVLIWAARARRRVIRIPSQ